MRKLLLSFIALTLITTPYIAAETAQAAQQSKPKMLQEEQSQTMVFVSYAGQEQRIENCIFDKGMTYVSINDISKLLKVSPKWTASTRTVSIEHEASTITWNTLTDNLRINNKDVKLTARPRIQNDRTYIPLSLLREVYALQYSWDSAAKTVTIQFGEAVPA